MQKPLPACSRPDAASLDSSWHCLYLGGSTAPGTIRTMKEVAAESINLLSSMTRQNTNSTASATAPRAAWIRGNQWASNHSSLNRPCHIGIPAGLRRSPGLGSSTGQMTSNRHDMTTQATTPVKSRPPESPRKCVPAAIRPIPGRSARCQRLFRASARSLPRASPRQSQHPGVRRRRAGAPSQHPNFAGRSHLNEPKSKCAGTQYRRVDDRLGRTLSRP
jgi:hypothetical protein